MVRWPDGVEQSAKEIATGRRWRFSRAPEAMLAEEIE
jgi:hypothetical protein